MGLEVTADEPKPGIHTVHAKGEIDLHSVELFEDVVHEVLAKNPKKLLIDLSGVTFMSSSGIGVIMAANAALDDKDDAIVLVGISGVVEESLKLIGLLDLFPIAKSIEEAMK